MIAAFQDITRRPGLAYQHAFDWLAVRLHAAGLAAYSVGAAWQFMEMARRLPHVPVIAIDPAARAVAAAALGLPELPDDEAGPLRAAALVEPAAFPGELLARLEPDGRLYAVTGGRAARFLDERQTNGAAALNEQALVSAARAAGFRVVERLGIHPPAAVLAHYAGEGALALGRRDWRDRRHFAMRRDFIATGPAVAWSALVCLTLERVG
jgi:hypothetical protein